MAARITHQTPRVTARRAVEKAQWSSADSMPWALMNSVSFSMSQMGAITKEQCELSEDIRKTEKVLRDSRRTFGTHEPVLKNVMWRGNIVLKWWSILLVLLFVLIILLSVGKDKIFLFKDTWFLPHCYFCIKINHFLPKKKYVNKEKNSLYSDHWTCGTHVYRGVGSVTVKDWAFGNFKGM